MKKIRRKKYEDNVEKKEEEIVKDVVTDYANVKSSVNVLRVFGKEHNINMLDPKGIEQASVILRKQEQEDRINRLIEEKINEKISSLDKKVTKAVDKLEVILDSLDIKKVDQENQQTLVYKKRGKELDG
jgi:hypothetical protein